MLTMTKLLLFEVRSTIKISWFIFCGYEHNIVKNIGLYCTGYSHFELAHATRACR